MAIKFGDSLENQNSAYPIVDLISNHAKGISYIDAFNTAGLNAIQVAKRGQGSVVIIKASGLAYVYTGTDTTNEVWGETTANWAPLGEATQSGNLLVQIPNDAWFGKYANNDIIPANGWNALEIIRDAVTGYLTPDFAFSGGQTNYNYSLSSQTASFNLSIQVKNNNQRSITAGSDAYKITEMTIRRRAATTNSSTTWTDYGSPIVLNQAFGGTVATFFQNLNAVIGTGGTPATQTLTLPESFTIGAATAGTSSTNNFYYAVELKSNNAQAAAAPTLYIYNTGQANSGFVNVADYQTPATTAFTPTRTSSTSPTYSTQTGSWAHDGTNRIIGDYGTNIAWTISNNNPSVPITSVKLQRKLDSGSWQDVATYVQNNPSAAQSYSFSNINDLAATASYAQIQYKILLTNGYAANQEVTNGNTTINMVHTAYLGKTLKDHRPTAAIINANPPNNVDLASADIIGFSTKRLARAGNAVQQFTQASANAVSVQSSANEFFFIALPVTYWNGTAAIATTELTTIQPVGSANQLTTWSTSKATLVTPVSGLNANAFTTATINVTNEFGHVRPYYIYRTNASNAYSAPVSLFIL
jgi:hypothetical protein